MQTYGLNSVIGFSKFQVNNYGAVDEENSVLRLLMFGVYPAMVFNQELEAECTQFPVIRSAFPVADIPSGNLTLDQVSMSIPCSYDLQYLPNMSATEAKCVVDWVNAAQQTNTRNFSTLGSSGDSHYVVPNDTYEN